MKNLYAIYDVYSALRSQSPEGYVWGEDKDDAVKEFGLNNNMGKDEMSGLGAFAVNAEEIRAKRDRLRKELVLLNNLF